MNTFDISSQEAKQIRRMQALSFAGNAAMALTWIAALAPLAIAPIVAMQRDLGRKVQIEVNTVSSRPLVRGINNPLCYPRCELASGSNR